MKLNKELLRKVRDHIASEPETFEWNDFGVETDCGTVGCIAGWANRLSGECMNDALAARKNLGLNYAQEEFLFFAEQYVGPDGTAFEEFGLDRPRDMSIAEALRRIDYLLALEIDDVASQDNDAPRSRISRVD